MSQPIGKIKSEIALLLERLSVGSTEAEGVDCKGEAEASIPGRVLWGFNLGELRVSVMHKTIKRMIYKGAFVLCPENKLE